MTLYSHRGARPAALPFRIHLSDGSTRTDPSTFTPEEIAGAGYVEAPEPAEFDSASEALEWDGSSWVVAALPPPPFPTLTRKELRSGLLSIDVFASDVLARIADIEDPRLREDAMINWEDTKEYERHHPLVDTLAVAFGLPSEQVDALWRWAAPTG